MMFMRFPIDAVFLGQADGRGPRSCVPSCPSIAACGRGPGSCRSSGAPRRPGAARRHDRGGRDRWSATWSAWPDGETPRTRAPRAPLRGESPISAVRHPRRRDRSPAPNRRPWRSTRPFRPPAPAAGVRGRRCARRAGRRWTPARAAGRRPDRPARRSAGAAAPARMVRPVRRDRPRRPARAQVRGRAAPRRPLGAGRRPTLGTGRRRRGRRHARARPRGPRTHERGYDQAALIARGRGRGTWGCRTRRCSRRERATIAQFELDRATAPPTSRARSWPVPGRAAGPDAVAGSSSSTTS